MRANALSAIRSALIGSRPRADFFNTIDPLRTLAFASIAAIFAIMHPFPEVTELSHLIDDELMQVSHDPFAIQFSFQRSTVVSEFAVQQTEPDGSLWKYECVLSDASAAVLHRLIGQTVTNLRREDFRLALIFGDGATLTIIGNDGPHEAGQIIGADKYIVF